MYKNKTLRPVYPIMKVVIRRIIWTKIIHLYFIGKTVLTIFDCVMRYILHYRLVNKVIEVIEK